MELATFISNLQTLAYQRGVLAIELEAIVLYLGDFIYKKKFVWDSVLFNVINKMNGCISGLS